jgi:hypothetical protein
MVVFDLTGQVHDVVFQGASHTPSSSVQKKRKEVCTWCKEVEFTNAVMVLARIVCVVMFIASQCKKQ